MVKIKEGYVMSRFQQQWFERQNALPRAASGTVAFYFKRQTKYPPRIYVFMHAELWCDRNRRPMGLFNEFPFLTRPMNREEIEYHHFDTRLCYHQYEDWDKLLYAEEKEADELDKEKAGTGTAFLTKLKSFRNRYALNGQGASVRQRDEHAGIKLPFLIDEQTDFTIVGQKTEKMGADEPFWIGDMSCTEVHGILAALAQYGHRLNAAVVSDMLEKERVGENRKAVVIALCLLYRNFGVEESKRKRVDPSKMLRAAEVSEARTRRNYVRRVWRSNRLFALTEIRQRYPDYPEEMLLNDLKIKKAKPKQKKQKPVLDLRRCQMQKLAARLNHPETTDKEYHDACCRIVMLQNAHDHRSPIALSVTLQKVTKVYTFPWQAREDMVKRFVSQANKVDITHENLAAYIDSNFSKLH